MPEGFGNETQTCEPANDQEMRKYSKMRLRPWLVTGFALSILFMFGTVAGWQEKLLFFPEELPHDYQFKFPVPFQELYLKSPDGARLNALHFKQPDAKGVVLYLHGNAGSLRTWGELHHDILPLGHDLFIPDYRTFGKSTGPLSEEALHQDALLAYRFLLKQYPEEKITVFGRSLGSGIAVKLASETSPRALILETAYFSMVELARLHYPYLPAGLLLKYTFRSDEWIRKVKCPVLFLHGTADLIVPHASGKRLADLIGEQGTFITLPGGQHNGLNEYAPYKEALRKALP